MLTTLAAQNWGTVVLRGILALALGVLAFAAPAPTLAALIFVFAVYAIADGILAIAFGIAAPSGPSWLLVIAGIVGIAIGVYTLVTPQVTAVALTLLIGTFAFVRGVAEVGTAIWLRNVIESAWLYVLSGIVSIAFGSFLIVAPGDGAFAILFVIGFYALFAGVMYLAIGLRLRGLNKTLQSASTTSAAPPPDGAGQGISQPEISGTNKKRRKEIGNGLQQAGGSTSGSCRGAGGPPWRPPPMRTTSSSRSGSTRPGPTGPDAWPRPISKPTPPPRRSSRRGSRRAPRRRAAWMPSRPRRSIARIRWTRTSRPPTRTCRSGRVRGDRLRRLGCREARVAILDAIDARVTADEKSAAIVERRAGRPGSGDCPDLASLRYPRTSRIFNLMIGEVTSMSEPERRRDPSYRPRTGWAPAVRPAPRTRSIAAPIGSRH